MLEVVIRFYTEPTKKKDMPVVDANNLPDNFMGIVIKADEKKLSSNPEIRETEKVMLDYIQPRLQSVIQCMGKGEPPIVVVFSPDAERAMGKMVETMIADAAVAQVMMSKLTPRNSNRVN